MEKPIAVALNPGAALHDEEARSSPWPTFWIASIAVFLVSLDTTVLYAAFNALRAGFPGATAAGLSWVLNAYTVVFAALLVPAGGLADTYGRKRVFLTGVAVFLLASAACGAATSVEFMVAARVVQAIGAALLTPSSLSLVLDAFPKEKRAVVVSIWGAVGGVAAAFGPGAGSFIVDALGWPWAFFINLPLGAVSLFAGMRRLPEVNGEGKGRRADWPGVLLLIAGVGAIALAITQSESPHWSAMQVAAAALSGFAILAAFIAWQRKAPSPVVDLALFRNRTYSAVNLATLAFGTAFAMMFFGYFAFMTGVWHYSLPVAGIAVTPGPLTVVPVAIMTGRLAARYGHRPFLVTGAVIYAMAGLWQLTIPGTEPAYLTQWLPGLLLSGTGVGMVLPSLSGAAVANLPPMHYAVGSAVNQAVRQIGTVLGVAFTVVFVGHAGLSRSDFVPLFGLHVALALTTALLCLAVNTRPAARRA
ncbi:MFS transporter [Noviherbaspirillum sp. ST9]|uniref:MFS transporter n=1 Tax=Noviherbaspirillum sp. ST9 TaxID=3401606 RepID=UPI003B58B123